MNDIEAIRRELAGAFRWAARLGYHEATANHFSAAVSDDGRQFLLNPRGRHFSRMRASELLLLDASAAGTTQRHPTRISRLGTCTPTSTSAFVAPEWCCTRICRTRRRCVVWPTSSS